MPTSTLTALLAAATLAIGIGSASAVSAAGQDTASVTVKYGDLNLSTQDGANAVLQRIGQAARQVCKPDTDIADLPGMGDWSRICERARIRDAVSHLDAPMVTAAFSGRSQVILAERDSH
ncbi:MAG TPA: UrcA family protein [Caulobacteraceae bacterium]|jgi:UrcA family protein